MARPSQCPTKGPAKGPAAWPNLDRQDLLIALNLNPRISRPALCRLAGELETWIAEPDPKRCAAEIGVPALQIARAREILPQAARLAGEERLKAEQQNVTILTSLGEHYPKALGQLSLAPPVLYLRGRLESLEPTRAIAIVGSRKMDAYGRECAKYFAGELASAGLMIVSGFAIGIDSLAHDCALEAGGMTLAVLGCGLDIDYPSGSRARAAGIAKNGALITEFPLGCQPRPFNFPIRNRLIAALADATLVIQAKKRSGSLITAHHALDLGRDIFAIPGRIFDELAMGTNELIADGALPALCVQDILERFGIESPPKKEPLPASPASEADLALPKAPKAKGNPLLEQLLKTSDGMLAEDLAVALTLPLDQILGGLLELELEGRIERHPGPVYLARRS